MSEEIWKSVVSHEGMYEVSDLVKVRRISTGRILKQWLDTAGRPQVSLFLGGKKTQILVSHLVADAFLPAKCPTDQVVRHLNDIPTDNRPCNLARGTRADNANDAIRNDKWHPHIGSANGCAKLTEDDVREIRLLYATGNHTYLELGLRFGVAKHTICQIVRRRAWKHVI
jgi:hypothetical protein